MLQGDILINIRPTNNNLVIEWLLNLAGIKQTGKFPKKQNRTCRACKFWFYSE